MTIFINNQLLTYDAIPKYPDGAWDFKPLLNNITLQKHNVIRVWCFDMEEFFKTLMIYKSLYHISRVEIIFEYLVGLRQDKVEGHVPDFAEFLSNILRPEGEGERFNFTLNVPHSWENYADYTDTYESLYLESENFLSGRDNRVLVFPDKTAYWRWGKGFYESESHITEKEPHEWPYFTKTRRESDGWITLKAPDFNVQGKEVLMIDDLLDGGYTAILASEELRKKGASKVHLHVHHGLFNLGSSYQRISEKLDTVSCNYYRHNIETGSDIPEGLIVKTKRFKGKLINNGA